MVLEPLHSESNAAYEAVLLEKTFLEKAMQKHYLRLTKLTLGTGRSKI